MKKLGKKTKIVVIILLILIIWLLLFTGIIYLRAKNFDKGLLEEIKESQELKAEVGEIDKISRNIFKWFEEDNRSEVSLVYKISTKTGESYSLKLILTDESYKFEIIH